MATSSLATKFEKTEKQHLATLAASKVKYFMCFGGSGSGKTFNLIRLVIIRALKVRSRHIIVRAKLAHANASIWYENMPEVLRLCFPNISYRKNIKDGFIKFANGSEIWVAGIDNKERTEKILGRSVSTIYINESSQVALEGFLMLYTRLRENSGLQLRFFLDCNPPGKLHWTYKYFIQKTNDDKQPLARPQDYDYIKMNPVDNRLHLPDDYISDLENLPGKFKERFWHGNFTDETEGAIIQQEWINNSRSHYRTYEELIKNVSLSLVVVGIDPAATNNEDSDLTGIVVCGVGKDLTENNEQELYVIADYSVKATPKEWATRALQAVNEFKANLIVIETNQGGDMCEHTLRSVNYNGKIEKIHTMQSKHVRAEPISALYQLQRVHHLNNLKLANLEEEISNYVPYLVQKSPDRLDALVHALTYISNNSSFVKLYQQLNIDKLKKIII